MATHPNAHILPSLQHFHDYFTNWSHFQFQLVCRNIRFRKHRQGFWSDENHWMRGPGSQMFHVLHWKVSFGNLPVTRDRPSLRGHPGDQIRHWLFLEQLFELLSKFCTVLWRISTRCKVLRAVITWILIKTYVKLEYSRIELRFCDTELWPGCGQWKFESVGWQRLRRIGRRFGHIAVRCSECRCRCWPFESLSCGMEWKGPGRPGRSLSVKFALPKTNHCVQFLIPSERFSCHFTSEEMWVEM